MTLSAENHAPVPRFMGRERMLPIILILPALAMVLVLFVYPLGYSFLSAFSTANSAFSVDNFLKVFDLYTTDIIFSLVIVGTSTLVIAVIAIAIGGYLILGENLLAVKVLNWLYRWPLFVPFIVAAQCMRTFLAKNGLLNNLLSSMGAIDLANASGFLDWRGIIMTFVWKQAPFVTLLVAGAMSSLDRSTFEAARNLGASRLRILLEIVTPQVAGPLGVGLILSFVTMMSVLSVPVMVSGGTPTMITVDMAYRINSFGDYGVANALGFISYLLTGAVAWIYLRRELKERAVRQ